MNRLAFALLVCLPSCLAAESHVSEPATQQATLPAQEMAVGDIRVEMGRAVRLQLKLEELPSLWQAASTLVHALAPASPFQPGTAPIEPIVLTVEWNDPLAGAKAVSVSSSVAEISVPSGPERTASYSILWKAPDSAFELRVPASPGAFKAQIVRPQPAIVVEATGSTEGVLLGDRVPVRVRIIEPGGAKSVHLYHRAVPSGTLTARALPYTSSPMDCSESSPANSLWTGTLPRPEDPHATLDYYIEIVDTRELRTTYGTADAPHRIRLREPRGESRQ